MNEMKEYIKLLKEIPYRPIREKSTLFFEIDTGKTTDTGDFVMETKQNDSGASGLVHPGLILSVQETEKGKVFTDVSLAYAQIEYSPKFNLDSYLDLVKNTGKVSDKVRNKLTSLECLLVKKDYIIAEFEI